MRKTPRRLARREILLAGAGLALLPAFGCSLPGSGPAPRRVRLSPADDFPPNLPSVGWTLQVLEPTATISINTAKMAFVADGGDIEYLKTGVWASRAPEMVMELTVESFKNSGGILTVGDRRARIRPDFELDMNLNAFQIEKTAEDAGIVRVALRARLVKRPRRNIVSTLNADADAEVTPMTLDNIVAAFDASLQDVMSQVVEWTLKTGVGA